MQKAIRFLILWFVTGIFYYAAEGVWHLGSGGWANIRMLPIGGFCIATAGSLHHLPGWYSVKVWVLSAVGAVLITLVEYGTGMLLNVHWGLQIWDYSDKALNIQGQICLPYSLLWFILLPAAIWLCDWLRYFMWGEGSFYSPLYIYKCFFTGKWLTNMVQS